MGWKEKFRKWNDSLFSEEPDECEQVEESTHYDIATICKNCNNRYSYLIEKGKKAEEILDDIECKVCKTKSLIKSTGDFFDDILLGLGEDIENDNI